MNGYELVRHQKTQDDNIDNRLPLTGGTLTGHVDGTTITMSGKITGQSLNLGDVNEDAFRSVFFRRNGHGGAVGMSTEGVTGQNDPALALEVGKVTADGSSFDGNHDIRYLFSKSVFYPNKDNEVELGHSNRKWKSVYANRLSGVTLRLTSTSDASETSVNHALQIGPDSGTNVRIDNNEIISLDNGTLSQFYINAKYLNIETTDQESRPSFRILTKNKNDASMRFYSTNNNKDVYWTIGKDVGETDTNSFFFLYSDQSPLAQGGEKVVEFTKDGAIRLLKNDKGFQGVATNGNPVQLAHVGGDNISRFGGGSHDANMKASFFMGGNHASLMANNKVTDTSGTVSGKVTLCCNGATYSDANNRVLEFYKESGANQYVFRHRGNNHAQGVYLGTANFRWNTLYAMSPANVTSDRELKENIEYIQEQDLSPQAKTTSDLSISEMYDFVKDNLNLAKYNYKSKKDEVEIGFVAQDVIYNEDGTDNKVGQYLVDPAKARENDTFLSYSTGTYTSIIAGALKHSINEIEALKQENQELKDRLKLIEEKLGI